MALLIGLEKYQLRPALRYCFTTASPVIVAVPLFTKVAVPSVSLLSRYIFPVKASDLVVGTVSFPPALTIISATSEFSSTVSSCPFNTRMDFASAVGAAVAFIHPVLFVDDCQVVISEIFPEDLVTK